MEENQGQNVVVSAENSVSGGQMIVFQIAGEHYALDIAKVAEIIPDQHLTRVPSTFEAVEGLIHFRGKVFAVINLHKRLGVAAPKPSGTQRRIIIVDDNAWPAGLLVEADPQIVQVHSHSYRAIPARSEPFDCVSAAMKAEDRLLLLLDIERVVNGVHSQPQPAVTASAV